MPVSRNSLLLETTVHVSYTLVLLYIVVPSRLALAYMLCTSTNVTGSAVGVGVTVGVGVAVGVGVGVIVGVTTGSIALKST